jgi:pilus assembly protein CpaD
MTTRTPLHRVKPAHMLGALLGLSAALGACTPQTTEVVTTASVSDDYRHRHPIAVTEANHSIVVFVGQARGGLSGPQRADVMGLAHSWVREGRYTPDDFRALPTIRLSYPRIAAVAGPCGLWPQDLGPNIDNAGYNENRSYHNFGCATQRNLAAMIDNPADLEQPRPESPAYTSRRDIAFDRYRKGTATATTYPEADKAKLSDSGK